MTERRQFYRIDHPVVIEHQSISDADIQSSGQPDQFEVSPHFLLHAQLRELDAEASQSLRRLGELSPAAEACYRVLNSKIDLIANSLAADILKLDRAVPQYINLSEGGLNFMSETPLTLGQALALKLVFPESRLGLLLYARVMRCSTTDSENEYEIGAEFLRMPESCRTQLARLILEAQARQRQQYMETPA